jgi:hypothetical protein
MSGSIYSGSPSTSQARAGSAQVTVNGEAIDIGEDLSYDVTNVKRETLTGLSGVQGYSETPKPGRIAFTVRDAGNLSIQAFNDMTSATVVVQLISGKTITGDGMWSTEVAEASAKDGTFKVTFEGANVTEG